MPKSADSSSSEGGYVFECTEFEVHRVNSEETLFTEHLETNEPSDCIISNPDSMKKEILNLDKNITTNKENVDIDQKCLKNGDHEIVIDDTLIISDSDILNGNEHDISQELFDNIQNDEHDVSRGSFRNVIVIDDERFTKSDSTNTSFEQNSEECGAPVDSDSSKQKVPEVNKLPLERIKSIMKCDPDVHSVSSDAVFAMARATELFLHRFGKESYETALKQNKHTVDKQDIELTIAGNPNLEFLDGAIDWKIPDD